ncbi:uncharacterized protein LTR77_000819 [Saxophila tyrrhenica]|uniref:Uncharacterized protein n=1 Tax=Saxophila tyrrhenica TaxID=1690608 RepID=A0AAV9PQC9_9PEZI|nr:hypothetical protein LTR77_000819 [Saxophila tyrrhenica]
MSSPPSPTQIFSPHSLRRALAATLHPNPSPDSAETLLKNGSYLRQLDERHSVLVREFDFALEEFERISEERDASEGKGGAEVEMVPNREYLRANNAVAKAERELGAFMDACAELEEMQGEWGRDEAEEWDGRKAMERLEREDAAADARVKVRYEERLRQAELENQDLIAQTIELKEQIEEAIKWARQQEHEKHEAGIASFEAQAKYAALKCEVLRAIEAGKLPRGWPHQKKAESPISSFGRQRKKRPDVCCIDGALDASNGDE